MTGDIDRMLGDHGARLRAVERDLAEMKAKIDKMYAMMMQARGGWKTIAAIAGISATLGALATKVGIPWR